MAHLTVAASESAFKQSFETLVKNVAWQEDDTGSFGPFTAGYDIEGHLEGGDVDLRNDNTVRIKELDIRWDRFEFSLGLDIPEICVGGGCINLPWPLPDICLPRICVFDDDPDVAITLDLAPFIAQEVSFTGSVLARYYDASLPTPPGFNPCAFLQGILVNNNLIKPLPNHNQWHIFIDPETIDVDLFDFPDIVGDLIEDTLTSAIVAIIPGGWVRDLILAIIGGIADLIRFILDIPDEIDEWLSDLFNVSFGLLDFLGTLVLDLFGNCVPIYRIDDPITMLSEEVNTNVLLSGAPVTLVPVQVPIPNLNVAVNDVEMIIQADMGV